MDTEISRRKLENLENIQIVNEGEHLYSITFDCIIKDRLLNVNHKLKCISKGQIDAEIEEILTKDGSHYNSYDTHIKIDFQSLATIDENGDYIIKFEEKVEK